MKKHLIYTLLLAAGLFNPSRITLAQNDEQVTKLGLPGDNFNLAAMLDIFQRSKTLEEFEAAINSDTAKLNNLDLNNDNQTDYIRVQDTPKDGLHTIVLTTDINKVESQDIAVIFVEKKENEVKIQVVGDEELYGENYIIEPAVAPEGGTPNPGYKGDGTMIINQTNNYYYDTENNFYGSRPSYSPYPSGWVIVIHLYGPVYQAWNSPWYWGYYPAWWKPWRPFYWDHYYHHWYYHHSWHGWWYWRAPHHHFEPHYNVYYQHRRQSQVFTNNRSAGVYNRTYQNPDPEPRPVGKANFPSHSLQPDKNPALIKPAQVRDSKDSKPVVPEEPKIRMDESERKEKAAHATEKKQDVKKTTEPERPVEIDKTEKKAPERKQEIKKSDTQPRRKTITEPKSPAKTAPVPPADVKEKERKPANPRSPAPTEEIKRK
jgi:hypothetical protein